MYNVPSDQLTKENGKFFRGHCNVCDHDYLLGRDIDWHSQNTKSISISIGVPLATKLDVNYFCPNCHSYLDPKRLVHITSKTPEWAHINGVIVKVYQSYNKSPSNSSFIDSIFVGTIPVSEVRSTVARFYEGTCSACGGSFLYMEAQHMKRHDLSDEYKNVIERVGRVKVASRVRDEKTTEMCWECPECFDTMSDTYKYYGPQQWGSLISSFVIHQDGKVYSVHTPADDSPLSTPSERNFEYDSFDEYFEDRYNNPNYDDDYDECIATYNSGRYTYQDPMDAIKELLDFPDRPRASSAGKRMLEKALS